MKHTHGEYGRDDRRLEALTGASTLPAALKRLTRGLRAHSLIVTVAAAVTLFTIPVAAEPGRLAIAAPDERLMFSDQIGDFVGVNPQIESVWLVDADTDAVIDQITDGVVFDRAVLPPNLNVMVEANDDTESVQLGHGGILVVRTQNAAPYALGGDIGGDYHAYPLPDGWHTVRARPFAADDATGSYGDEVLISFAIFEHEIVVDSTIDAHDSAPGDGVCASNLAGGIDGFVTRTSVGDHGRIGPAYRDFRMTANDQNPGRPNQQRTLFLAGPCTLRAAIEESNARAGTQRIVVPNLGGAYDTPLGTLEVTAPVTIEGTDLPVVDANDTHRLLLIDDADGVDINGIVLRNGDSRVNNSNGGNILIIDSSVEIVDSEIRDGLATNGGGISVYFSDLTVLRSRISGNRAGAPDHTESAIGGLNQWGGGLHIIESDVTIDSTSVYDNGAVRGAGMVIAGDSTVFVTNTAIVENEAFQQGGGLATVGVLGGDEDDVPEVYIAWTTIARNAGTLPGSHEPGEANKWTGGGLWINEGDVIIGNSIVAENTILQDELMDTYGPDCYVGTNASFTSYRGNVIGELTDACALLDPHVGAMLTWDTFGTTGMPFDAHLGATLQGTRPTIVPLVQSIAVDHGSDNPAIQFFGPCPTADVRGVIRPADPSLCDIGATER